ncbi:hypothetical protein FOL47_000803 [Perkinsus chesapeaki]|uniref:Uncharacterized protein n=1 Tax=Perkinsus chesapeaki TaxID=330153 RepID=A0A7J6KVD3_PERCH|nr:hypothetical protein FOL47_000803 [Perkinsus chesapeaki]
MSVHHIQRQSFVRKVSAGETIGDYSDPQFVRDMSIEMVHQSRAEEAANFQDGSSVNACLPGSKPSLARSQLPLLSLLVSCIVSSSLPTFCDSIVGSPSPDEQIILRRKVASVVDDILVRLPERGVDVSVARVGGSLRPHILGALLSEIDDPESHLPPESSLVVALDGGVNIGYHSTIVTTGLYPPFSAKLSPDEPLKLVWSTTNYKSAEGDLAPLVDEVLRDEVSSGFLLPVTESQVQHVCRLAAIPKNGCSGPTVRLISDHRRSGLNGLLSCDESCALPYLRDLLLLLHPITVTGHSLTSIQLDISHAFRTIRVSPRDVPLLGVHHKDSFYLDLALPFGLRSSPYWWNRLSSTIHRVMSVFVRLSDLSQSVREGGLTCDPSSALCFMDLIGL